jgi:hypothetical protein
MDIGSTIRFNLFYVSGGLVIVILLINLIVCIIMLHGSVWEEL